MKTIKHLSAALVSVLLLAGVATQASAIDPERLPSLRGGESPPHLIDGKDHYRISVKDSTQLSIRSHVWTGENPSVVRMSGRLLDVNGEVVAEGRREKGHFVLDQSVDPGEYILEVDGREIGGRQEGAKRYYLQTRMN
ncbi:MAG TPA: hypothetical protein VLO12_08160 [Halomonas sp.]|nr:hypothetical protein [Halomonas sp.]